jgi:hypothetical protein
MDSEPSFSNGARIPGKWLWVVVLVVGAYQHCSHEGFLYSDPPNGVPSFISRGAAHTKRSERPLLAKDGTKAKEI